jgi:anti-anti-sigma factor
VDTARIRARIERQYVLLHVRSDLDADGARSLAQELDDIEPNTDVVLDMSEVRCCTDEGWDMLSHATRRITAADGSLTLSRLSPDVRAQLRGSGFADQIKVRRKGR